MVGSPPQQSLKGLPALPANVEGPATFKYEFGGVSVGTNPEGDTFQVMHLPVSRDGKPLGVMHIWHNRNGAYAHFVDTQTGAM